MILQLNKLIFKLPLLFSANCYCQQAALFTLGLQGSIKTISFSNISDIWIKYSNTFEIRIEIKDAERHPPVKVTELED